MKTTLPLALGIFCVAGVALAADRVAPAGKPAADAAAAPKLPARSTIDWEKMTVAQRKKYMKATVLPEMKKLYVGFDKKYKNMTCMTCHGSKAVENKYQMPNPELPKLPGPTDQAGFMALAQKKPEAAKFMGTQVKPTMVALLNLQAMSPATPKGFSCYSCHTTASTPASAPAAAPPAAKAAGGGW